MSPRSGRPKILTDEKMKVLLDQVKKFPRISSEKLANIINSKYGISITGRAIRQNLNSHGLNARFTCKKPYISEKNQRQRRLELAMVWYLEPITYWNFVIYSDECKICLSGSDGIVRVWRPVNTRYEKEYLLPTFKHGGGSLMVWACMAANGVGNLVFILETMDGLKYCRILFGNLVLPKIGSFFLYFPAR